MGIMPYLYSSTGIPTVTLILTLTLTDTKTNPNPNLARLKPTSPTNNKMAKLIAWW